MHRRTSKKVPSEFRNSAPRTFPGSHVPLPKNQQNISSGTYMKEDAKNEKNISDFEDNIDMVSPSNRVNYFSDYSFGLPNLIPIEFLVDPGVALQSTIPQITVEEFNTSSAMDFVDFMNSAIKNPSPYIIINVNSYGGDVRALVLMVSAIKRAKYFGKIIVTFCAGYAMSCGSVLMALGTNGYRYGTLDCCILMHQIRSGCRGPLATQEMELLESESLNTKIFVWMAENAGLADVEYYAKLVDNAKVDLYFTAKQAKELRLIDHIGYPRFVHKVSQDYFIVPVQEENSHDQNIINTILDKVHKFKDIIPPALKPQSTPTNKSSSAAVTVDRADTQLPIKENVVTAPSTPLSSMTNGLQNMEPKSNESIMNHYIGSANKRSETSNSTVSPLFRYYGKGGF